MSEHFRVGPCKLLTATNLTDIVDNWYDMGSSRGDATVTFLDGRVALGKTDQEGNTPLAKAVWQHDSQMEFSVPLLDRQISTLLNAMPHAVKKTNNSKDALAVGSGLKNLTPVAWALLPLSQYSSGTPWWDARDAYWIFKGVALVPSTFETFNRPEGDDALSQNTYEIQITQFTDNSTYIAGVGHIHLFGLDPLGFNNQTELEHAVTDATTRNALGAVSIGTVRQLVDDATSGGTTNLTPTNTTYTITDITGLKYWFDNNQDNKGTLNLSGNNISQADASSLIDHLWSYRNEVDFGALDLANNNGVSATASDQINGTGAYSQAVSSIDTTRTAFVVSGNHEDKIWEDVTFEISGSTNNDGEYTCAYAVYDAANDETIIAIQGSITDTADTSGTVDMGIIQESYNPTITV